MAEMNPPISGDSPITQMRLISTRIDDDGMPITITKVREAAVAMAAATPPNESVSGGIWTKTYQEPISDLLCWKVTESRVLATGSPGPTVSPIIREDRWNDQFGVVMSSFWQYVPEGTTKKVIDSSYSTADTYVSDHLTAVTVSDPGSGYTTIPTLTISASNGGGTQATATVTSLAVVGAVVSAPGTGYVFGDTLTVAGGTFSSAATLTVSGGTLATLALNAAGTGYAPNDTITLDGGVASAASTLTVVTTKVVSVSVVYAGTGGSTAPGSYALAGTTGSGTVVLFTATNNGSGQLLTISLGGFAGNGGGSYTANPTNLASEPTVGGGFTSDPPIVSLVMGIATFVITSGGQYSAPATTTFTAGSTSGSGTGATFQTATYTINQLTVLSGGAYTVIPTSPNAVTDATSASGMTVNLDFGVGAVALGTAGTLYYYPPTITPSYGDALITPTMSDLILLPGSPAGYVVDTGLLNTEHAMIKRLVWTTMTTPPTRIERASQQFPLPVVFTYISGWSVTPPTGLTMAGPFPGVNFTMVNHGVSVRPARCTISYTRGPSESVPATWQVITPGDASRIFPIGTNTIHNSWVAIETNGSSTQIIEIIEASTPTSYVHGQTLIVNASERKVIGNFYERRIYSVN